MSPGARKIRLAILCGGPSPEHRISLLSSRNILAGAAPDRYDVVLVGIDPAGRWFLYEEARHLVAAGAAARVALAPGGRPVTPVRAAEGGRLMALDGPPATWQVDVAFPVMHGPFGEDGVIQGLLAAVGIPCVGCGVTASALCMDKEHTKQVLRSASLPVNDWVTLRRHDRELPSLHALTRRLGPLPYFVKPANMGSSVGISEVRHPAALRPAVELAFQYDAKALVEPAVPGRELECAVLGGDRPEASGVGEIATGEGFYDYEAKYLDDSAAELRPVAPLDETTREGVRALAVRAFRVLGCRGLARVDFFLREDGKLLLNEVNTMPGFTRISMYPKLWELAGVPLTDLVDRLVALALDRPPNVLAGVEPGRAGREVE